MITVNSCFKSCLCTTFALLSLVLFVPNANAVFIYNIPLTTFTGGSNPLGSISGTFTWDGVANSNSTLPFVNISTTSNGNGFGDSVYASGSYNSGLSAFTFNILGGNLLQINVSSNILTSATETTSTARAGRSVDFSISPEVAVPEPGTYAILAGGLAMGALAAAKRRKSKLV